ncbi:MAG: LPS O-antigen chain length determinant protein WzzB [Gammaproteobacteria bacterium]|nr:LPS O-antigen chain length determinant protein WzzB [Gammaproteobacteria bacterium]
MNSDQQAPNLTTYQPQSAYGDEISLVDIVSVLLRRKKLILGITAITVCIGLFYAFSQKRVYQVETILLPPSFENIQPLNVLNSSNVNSSNVNSSNVFASFTGNINSRKLKKDFFDKFKILETLSVGSTQVMTEKNINSVFEGFSDAFKVKADKKTSSTRITLEGVHKDKIGPWLDSFVAIANQETNNQLVRNLQANIDSKIKSLKINISSKRSIYKQRREDELGRLEEAYQIAKSLGIRDYNNMSSMPSKNNNLSIYMQEKKIYMQGTRVLQAEITALKNRKSDDIHITGLRDLQEQLTRLEAITIEKDKLQTVIVDKKAIVNIEPIRPKRKLIVILSLILGGMLGIFAVFIMEFISNFKKQVNNVDVV